MTLRGPVADGLSLAEFNSLQQRSQKHQKQEAASKDPDAILASSYMKLRHASLVAMHSKASGTSSEQCVPDVVRRNLFSALDASICKKDIIRSVKAWKRADRDDLSLIEEVTSR